MTLNINDQNFDATIAEGYTFVDFWAEWCGPCRMLGPVIDELAHDYEGKVRVAKLNIDENRQTTQKFGVMSIPTMILFKDGQPIEKIQGFQPKAALTQYLDSKL